MHVKEKPRRRHSKEFKTRIVAAFAAPGASVAAVAQSNGLNANLVHQWRRGRGFSAEGVAAVAAPAAKFVALALPPAPALPTAVVTAQEIRMELNRGALKVSVSWPVSAASECATWLRELLR